jgi:hypothetical protein
VAQTKTSHKQNGAVASAVWVLTVGAAMLALTLPVWAQDAGGKVEVHGFGGWAYGKSEGNNYLIGTTDGTYDNVAFALNVNAKVSDRLTVVGQFEFQQRPGYKDMDRTLDFAFAEWKISDALKLRAGRVKHPFGIYGEIFNVGTLRPFYMLPQSIYGPERFTARSVDGLGLTGQKNWESGWGVNYDLYVGRISGELRLVGVLADANAPPLDLKAGLQSVPFGFDEVVGARLNVTTPVEGLSLGSSAYRGKATGFYSPGSKLLSLGFHGEYQVAPVLIRAEYGTALNDPFLRYDTYYVEGAVKVWKGFQLAARYDRWNGHFADAALQSVPFLAAGLQHRDIVFGVNHWFSPNFVMKASYHIVHANRFAAPNDPTAALAVGGGILEPDTKMFVFGTQFSF